jgi:branched-chain amino acid transport system substrate-binding protein
VPANFYWVGPYAAGGSGIAGGMLDYLDMLNVRDGGVTGVKVFLKQEPRTARAVR